MIPAGRCRVVPSRSMTPTYRMPNPQRLYDEATAADLRNALSAARCSAERAGRQTEEVVVPDLLVTVIEQTEPAAAAARRAKAAERTERPAPEPPVTGRLRPPGSAAR